MSDHAHALFEKVKDLFTEPELNHTNVLKFLEIAMEVVEIETELSGAQKKALVIEAIKIAIKEMIPDEEEYKVMEMYVDLFIDHTIDEIIEINDGKLKINPKQSKFYKFFSCCTGLFRGPCCPGLRRRLPCLRSQDGETDQVEPTDETDQVEPTDGEGEEDKPTDETDQGDAADGETDQVEPTEEAAETEETA